MLEALRRWFASGDDRVTSMDFAIDRDGATSPLITWTCHVCGDERPDGLISVHSYDILFSGIVMGQNIRYCNDRAACIAGAPDVQHVPGERVL